MSKLTKEIKAELKEQHEKIYLTVLDNEQEIVWRPIKRSEYREIITSTDLSKTEDEIIIERQEQTCKRCIVFPSGEELEKLLEEYAGVAISICSEIYDKSGFDVKLQTKEL
jgi:hypothetical protein